MKVLPILVVLAAGFLAACGQTQVGGSGTSAGNGITARIMDGSGRPVAGATVVARPADWTGEPGVDTLVATTDSQGGAHLELPRGRWYIDARGAGLAGGLRASLDADTVVWTARLGRTGSLEGILPAKYAGSSARTRICVLGAGRCATPDSAGRYRIDGLPAHAARVVYIGSGSSPASDTMDGIRLIADSTARIDSSARPAFEDDFRDGAVSSAFWKPRLGDGCPALCRWGNEYLTTFVDDPAHLAVDDSGLVIRATRGENGRYLSSSIAGRGLRSFLHGRFEIEARIPTTRGIWTLLSLFPTGEDFGPWPASGSIDIASLPGIFPDTVRQFAHYKVDTSYAYAEGKVASADTGWSRRFHRFACEWRRDGIRWSIDDSVVFEHLVTAPFDRPFHFQIELHAGGKPYGPPDSTTRFPAELRIRRIRVTQPWI